MSKPRSELRGQPVNRLTGQPQPESEWNSRIGTAVLGLRLPLELIRDIKGYCAKRGIKLQDVTAQFYTSLLADPGQPVNRLTACVCSSSVCVCGFRKQEENTHTPGQPVNRLTAEMRPQGQPVLPHTGGGELIEMPAVRRPNSSSYDLRTRRRYATTHTSRNAKGEQIPLGEGWIIKGGDGRYDEMIEEWLTETSKPDPKTCPDCGGTGFVTQTLFDGKGAQKCTHPALKGTTA